MDMLNLAAETPLGFLQPGVGSCAGGVSCLLLAFALCAGRTSTPGACTQCEQCRDLNHINLCRCRLRAVQCALKGLQDPRPCGGTLLFRRRDG